MPKWTTITKDDVLRRWPGLQYSPSVPEWPASLIGNADNIYCTERIIVEEKGGIHAVDLFFSGTRAQVVEAAHVLSAALRFQLSDGEKKELARKRILLLRQMERVPPVGLDIELIENLNGNRADWGVKLTVMTFD